MKAYIPDDATYQWTRIQQHKPRTYDSYERKQQKEKTKKKQHRRTYWKEQKQHWHAEGRGAEKGVRVYVCVCAREKSLFVNDKGNLEFKFSIGYLSFHHLNVLCVQCVFLSVRVATHSHYSVRLYKRTQTLATYCESESSHIYLMDLCGIQSLTHTLTLTCAELILFGISHCSCMCVCVCCCS